MAQKWNLFSSVFHARGELDGTPCVLEWKTTSARYQEEPAGSSALDPQLVCYSWMTGIDEVAQIVFVRKRPVEVQYLRATITEEQHQEFAVLVFEQWGVCRGLTYSGNDSHPNGSVYPF